MAAEVTVVGIGCELDRLYAGQTPVLPIPGLPRREDARDVLDAVSGPVRNGDAVIVIVGDWVAPEVLDRLIMVRSLLDTSRVAIHVTSLPPLATSVLAAATAALAPHAISAGALAGAIPEITCQLAVLAWTSSVAGLQHPDVSLVDHARSALPWSSFAVGLAPETFVQPLASGAAVLELAPLREPSSLLLAPGEKAEPGDLDIVLETVVPALGAVQLRQLEPSMHASAWWGTARAIEVVGVPVDLGRLAELTLPREARPCRWCEEPIASLPCPFCGEASGRRGGRAGTLHPTHGGRDRDGARPAGPDNDVVSTGRTI